jgi:hypothetical protein
MVLGEWYLLPNGVCLPLAAQTAWCEDCNGMRRAESLSRDQANHALARAEQRLAAIGPRPARRWWQPWNTAQEQWDAQQFALQSASDDAHARITLLETRRAPPRCLVCGGTRLHTPARGLPSNNGSRNLTGITHPRCGGEIQSEVDFDGTRFLLKPVARFHTPEGERIEAERATNAPPATDSQQIILWNARARGRPIPPSAESAPLEILAALWHKSDY